MSEKNLLELVESYREWLALSEEANAMTENLRDQIKAEMVARNVEELPIADRYVARFTTVQSSRFDTKRFKEKFGEELYKSLCKEVTSKRFSLT